MAEHGEPERIQPSKLADYLEVMSKAVFQTGISWAVVNKKWPGIREAFDGFDPVKVAEFKPDDIDRLVADQRVIRNRRKIEGISHNAHTMLDLEREHGAFQTYLRSKGDYESLVADMRKRFKFLGDTGAYFFLWVVSEPVPDYHEWRQTHESVRPAPGTSR
jgi:3-methyladenine DNA glycosylase Tag